MYLGIVQVVGSLIQPGACATIESASFGATAPDVRGPQVQVEVCSPRDPQTGQQDLSIGCLDNTLDASIGFFATTGDIVASTITNCLLPPFQEACRTPATFFWERPQDVYAAVATVNSGQSPEGQPKARIRSELYINDDRMDLSSGSETIVEHDF
jgi:hypothetical protein